MLTLGDSEQTARPNSLKRIRNACHFSIKGIRASWKTEAAFREELLLACILIPSAFLIGYNLTQTALLIFPIFLVLMIELLNTSIEHIVDRIGPEQHPLSGQAKDAGSAAVFIGNCLTTSIWLLICLDNFIF